MIYIIIGLLLIIVITGIRIVPQAHSFVIERLGSYKETWGNGLHFKLPFIDKVASKLTLKEMVRDFDPQSVITKDNVTMMIDTVVYFQITDPKLYTYGVEHPMNAIENLKIRLQKYLDTGNTEYLADVANFAMLEFMKPKENILLS